MSRPVVHLVLLVCLSVSACGGGHTSTPTFRVWLGDDGLHHPTGKFAAGPYLVTFDDRRTKPAPRGSVALVFTPAAPINLFSVAAGQTSRCVLLAGMDIHIEVDGTTLNAPSVDGGFQITATAGYPTQVT